MPTFGLVVEGRYDQAVLKELIQKCAPDHVEVIGRPCGDVGKLMRRFPGFLQEFRYRGDVNKALVVRDAGKKDPKKIKSRMEVMISNRNYPFPVKLLVIVQELEAWLLADESAISSVTQKQVARIQNPENVTDPKERLKRLLSEARISYTDEIARRIAANTKVDTVESRCPSFKKFQEAVVDC